MKTTLICEHQDTDLECSEGLYWFDKGTVLGSPRSMTSLASWLGFQYDLPLVEWVLHLIRELLVTTEVCVPLLQP